VSGFIIGGVIGGIASSIRGNGFMEGAAEGALYGAINGFSAGAIFYCIGQGVSGVVNACNKAEAKRFLMSNGLSKAKAKEAIAAFDGVPKVQTLTADTTVYRAWGGNPATGGSAKIGPWVSQNNYGTSARSWLSISASNAMTHTSAFMVPAGTQVLTGTAAPLFGQVGGGIQWWLALWLI